MTGIHYIDRVLCHTKGGTINNSYSIPKEALAQDAPRPEPDNGYDVFRHPDTLVTIKFCDGTTQVLREEEFVRETPTGSLEVFTQSQYWVYEPHRCEVRLPDGSYHRWISEWYKRYGYYNQPRQPTYTYAEGVWTVVTREPIVEDQPPFEEAPKGGR